MKILSRKFTAIVLLAVTSISALAIGVSALGYNPAVAESAQITLPENIVYKNVEDCIYDITAASVNGGIQYANGLEARDLGYVTKEDVIISNEKGQDKINVNNVKYSGDNSYFGLYTQKASESDSTYNGNAYNGNIYVWNKSTSQAKYSQNQMLFYTGSTDTIVTFRMMYTAGNLYQFNEDVPNLGSWNYYHRYTIETDGSIKIIGDGTEVKSYSASALLTSLQAKETDATALYETGDMLLISVGSYHTDTEKTNYYYKVVNETKGYTVFELLEEGAYAENKSGSFVIYWQGVGRQETKFNLCGVNKPLFANYDYAQETELDGSYVGKSATAVALKDSYSHVEGNEQILVLGENKIKVNYTLNEYFGAPSTVSAYVTVNVKANVVTLKDMAGNELGTQEVVDSIELPTIEREKTFIAYKAEDGKLYKQGETVAIAGNATFTLIEADVEILEEVAIRLSNDEFGGLRFGVKILTADYVALQQAGVNFATKIAGETVNLVPATQDADYSIAYFAKTDIEAEDFNTDINAEIVVTYDSGASTVVSATANICEIASDLAERNEIAIMGGQAIYNSTAAQMLKKYLDAVNA